MRIGTSASGRGHVHARGSGRSGPVRSSPPSARSVGRTSSNGRCSRAVSATPSSSTTSQRRSPARPHGSTVASVNASPAARLHREAVDRGEGHGTRRVYGCTMAACTTIAEQVRAWLAEGRDVTVAQVVEARGFSSREPGAAAAWPADGERAGRPAAGRDRAGRARRHRAGRDHGRAWTRRWRPGWPAAGTRVGARPAGGRAIRSRRGRGWSPANRCAWSPPLPAGPTDDVHPGEHPRRVPVRRPGAAAVRPRGHRDRRRRRRSPAPSVALWPVPDAGRRRRRADRRRAARHRGPARLAVPDRGRGRRRGRRGRVALQRSDAVVVLSHDRDVDGPALSAALGPAGRLRRRARLAAHAGGAPRVAHRARRRRGRPGAHPRPGRAGHRRAHAGRDRDLDRRRDPRQPGGVGGRRAARPRPGPVHAARASHAPPPRY